MSELATIIPESMLNNKNVDLNKLIEDNTEYFYHLAGILLFFNPIK